MPSDGDQSTDPRGRAAVRRFLLDGFAATWSGPTMVLFVLGVRGIRDNWSLIVVFENVPRFPITLLESMFGDLYDIDDSVIGASRLGGPCERKRLYCILSLRRHIVISRPLSDLLDYIGSSMDCGLGASDLVFEPGAGLTFSASALRYRAGYDELFGYDGGFYDLTQNPRERPRACGETNPPFTLTTNSSLIWSSREKRCLSASGLGAVLLTRPSRAVWECRS